MDLAGDFFEAEAGVEVGSNLVLRQGFDAGAFHALRAHIFEAVLEEFAADTAPLHRG